MSPTNPASSTWTDAVYISPDSTLDTGGHPSDQRRRARLSRRSMPEPATRATSRSPSRPTSRRGTITSSSWPTPTAASSSPTPARYQRPGRRTITLVAPDLQVTGVSGPASGFNSQAVLVSWTDENEGTSHGDRPWVDDVYAATDAQGDNPTLLGSFEFDGSLAVGASVQRTQQVNLPRIRARTG